MTAEEIARVAHEANRAMTYLVADVPVQEPWDGIDADMKQSCVTGVTFVLNNPKATAQQVHEEWCEARWEQGWQWGAQKSVAAKTHPALRPYGELSEGTRRKDVLFRAIVEALR